MWLHALATLSVHEQGMHARSRMQQGQKRKRGLDMARPLSVALG
jgi:hypothetical protein